MSIYNKMSSDKDKGQSFKQPIFRGISDRLDSFVGWEGGYKS